MGRRAFTLVEILVVTSIIAILVGIIGTALAGAKADAKKSSCAFNLRQMGLGVSAYILDFDDVYPQSKGQSTNNPQVDDADGSIELPDRGSVLSMLGRYSSGISECPSDPAREGSNCDAINPTGPSVNSYLVNGYFVWGLRESQVRSVADTVYLAERRSYGVGLAPEICDVIFHPWWNPNNPVAPRDDMTEPTAAIATTRHQDGANYEFADGHAAWRKYGETWGPNIDHYTP